MKIQSIKLTNFRNHVKSEFEFNSDVTFIVGPNGAGKTNVLEAVFMLAAGKSPKARFDRDVVRHGEGFALI